MVNLKSKLSFSPVYFMSSVYKRARFASSFPYPCCCCSSGCSVPCFVTDCSGLLTGSGISVLVEGIDVGIGEVAVGIGGGGIEGVVVGTGGGGIEGVAVGVGGVGTGAFSPLLRM